MKKNNKDEKKNQVQVLAEQCDDSRVIETKARPLQEGSGCTLVEVHLITGRTHQIRAHLNSVGYPVIGDEKYGDRKLNQMIQNKYGLSSQFLHAYRLKFADAIAPLEYLKGREFIAPLTPILQSVKEGLFDGIEPPKRDHREGQRRERQQNRNYRTKTTKKRED